MIKLLKRKIVDNQTKKILSALNTLDEQVDDLEDYQKQNLFKLHIKFTNLIKTLKHKWHEKSDNSKNRNYS